MFTRRRFILTSLAAAGSCTFSFLADSEAQPQQPRRRRHRVRRRVRRRHRRRVAIRHHNGRDVWVVPVSLAAGWELQHDNRVVIVRSVNVVEVDGAQTEVIVVENEDGSTEEVEILREDSGDNSVELEGSELDDSDTSTPSVDVEVEEWVEE